MTINSLYYIELTLSKMDHTRKKENYVDCDISIEGNRKLRL